MCQLGGRYVRYFVAPPAPCQALSELVSDPCEERLEAPGGGLLWNVGVSLCQDGRESPVWIELAVVVVHKNNEMYVNFFLM